MYWTPMALNWKSTAYVISVIRLLKTTITLFMLNHKGISSTLATPYELPNNFIGTPK